MEYFFSSLLGPEHQRSIRAHPHAVVSLTLGWLLLRRPGPLRIRSWCYSEKNKRRTLQKEDIQAAIRKTEIFDFLVDVIQ